MDNVFRDLIISYDRASDERDQGVVCEWKKDLRLEFLNLLAKERKSTLVDIGAGTGIHAKFFHDNGTEVFCIDLSPELVGKCEDKGLSAQVMNILEMSTFDRSFDSAFALNSLLHIPLEDMPTALGNIANLLNPEGLLLWGQYGGEYREGIFQDDHYEPKRFFSLLDDNQIQVLARKFFKVESFNRIEIETIAPLYFQWLLLRV